MSHEMHYHFSDKYILTVTCKQASFRPLDKQWLREKDSQRLSTRRIIAGRIRKAQIEIAKRHYQRHSVLNSHDFHVGQLVRLRNHKRYDRKGGKLLMLWSQKVYSISACHGRNVYRLEGMAKAVNGKHLKQSFSI
jgi:hypothetical protein